MTLAVRFSALPLRVGRRTLWRFKKPLARLRLTLSQGLAGELPAAGALPRDASGLLVTALPETLLPAVRAAWPDLKGFVRQAYPRAFAALDMNFDAYLAGFSAKSRSTLKRKARKFAERSGGAIDLRAYHTPDEMAEFHALARTVSARTYQEQRFGAGLPDGPEALTELRGLAARDSVRGWLLFLDGRPVSYLHAPAEGDTLIYAHLGYDPDFADLSPGTVLQLEAMRALMAERRFRWFDFTEGDGQHKRLFATGTLDCVDLLLLRRTAGNLIAGHVLNGVDGAVATAKGALARIGAERLVRSVLR
jgi:CelD/BcsL family acetyltransferase involved in cellulose biosynthesis